MFKKGIFANALIRKKFIFTVLMIVFYRFLANIPPPGVEVDEFIRVFGDSALATIFTLTTGGSLSSPSIVMLGLGAYINASIIIQLLGTVIPKLEELRKEGAKGREIMSMYTRYLTVPLAIIQTVVIYFVISRTTTGLVDTGFGMDAVAFVASVVAGSMLLVWIGDLIKEKGIGNGISIIISFSIISSLPQLLMNDLGGVSNVYNSFREGALNLWEFLTTSDMLLLYGIFIGLLLLTMLIVFVNEGIRKINIQYSRRAVGTQGSFLPIRVNQAGVIPVIFASAIITFPTIVAQMLGNMEIQNQYISGFVEGVNNSFIVDFNSIGYNVFYALLIIGFAFFYTFVVMKPSEISENLQKSGGYIPGIRPGKQTEIFVKNVMLNLTIAGSLFLAFVALFPSIARIQVGSVVSGDLGLISGIGGTSLLIIVSVLIQTYRAVNSMQATESYDKYK